MESLRPMKTYVATFTRDPYATCASWHKRYGSDAIIRNWTPTEDSSALQSEAEYFGFLGRIWLERAHMLLKARQESVADVRYEDFADDPRAVVEKLAGKIPQLEGVLTDATVSVKDYGESSIVNMNERQIATLSDEQISAISLSLSARPHVVESLGYSIR